MTDLGILLYLAIVILGMMAMLLWISRDYNKLKAELTSTKAELRKVKAQPVRYVDTSTRPLQKLQIVRMIPGFVHEETLENYVKIEKMMAERTMSDEVQKLIEWDYQQRADMRNERRLVGTLYIATKEN